MPQCVLTPQCVIKSATSHLTILLHCYLVQINYLSYVPTPHLGKQEGLLIHRCSFSCSLKYSLGLVLLVFFFSAGRSLLKNYRSQWGLAWQRWVRDPLEPISGGAVGRKKRRLTDLITGFKKANTRHSWDALLSSVWQSYEQERRNTVKVVNDISHYPPEVELRKFVLAVKTAEMYKDNLEDIVTALQLIWTHPNCPQLMTFSVCSFLHLESSSNKLLLHFLQLCSSPRTLAVFLLFPHWMIKHTHVKTGMVGENKWEKNLIHTVAHERHFGLIQKLEGKK